MVNNDAYDTILRRRSCRTFMAGGVSTEQIRLLLNAAFSAPYAAVGSRHYAVVHDYSTLMRLNEAAKAAAMSLGIPHLQELAARESYNCLYEAPAAIVISGSTESVAPESDCAAAAQNILLAAQALGLGSCWIFFPMLAFEGEEGDAWRAELKIPDGHKPLATVIVGYRKGAAPPPAKRSEPVSYIHYGS